MTARGLWQDENGRFYRETMHSYIDLEYWREKPKGLRRALPALGMFMQGKIEPEFFFDVYDTILAQERASNLGDHLGGGYVRDALQALCMM